MSKVTFDLSEHVTLLLIAVLGVAFAAYCVSMGHNSTLISSTFTLLGAIVGYVVGRKIGGGEDEQD